jgi:hypothetical protein
VAVVSAVCGARISSREQWDRPRRDASLRVIADAQAEHRYPRPDVEAAHRILTFDGWLNQAWDRNHARPWHQSRFAICMPQTGARAAAAGWRK